MSLFSKTELGFIKETMYFTGTQPILDRLLYSSRKRKDWMRLPGTWIMYLDLNPVQLVDARHFTHYHHFRIPLFQDLLQKLNPFNVDQITYLIRVYMDRLPDHLLFQEVKCKDNPFKDFTKETYGRLLFYDQAIAAFENVLRITHEEATQWVYGLTKNYNKLVVGKTLTRFLTSTYTLMDAWQDYTLSGLLLNPKREIANQIYNQLNLQK